MRLLHLSRYKKDPFKTQVRGQKSGVQHDPNICIAIAHSLPQAQQVSISSSRINNLRDAEKETKETNCVACNAVLVSTSFPCDLWHFLLSFSVPVSLTNTV